MNKKAVMPVFYGLIGLVIAAVLIVPLATVSLRLFGTQSGASELEDFNIFIKDFKKMNYDGGRKFVIDFQEKSRLVFFNKKEDAIKLEYEEENWVFYKPDSCSDNSCICLCQNFQKEEGLYFCESMYCEKTVNDFFVSQVFFDISGGYIHGSKSGKGFYLSLNKEKIAVCLDYCTIEEIEAKSSSEKVEDYVNRDYDPQPVNPSELPG